MEVVVKGMVVNGRARIQGFQLLIKLLLLHGRTVRIGLQIFMSYYRLGQKQEMKMFRNIFKKTEAEKLDYDSISSSD